MKKKLFLITACFMAQIFAINNTNDNAKKPDTLTWNLRYKLWANSFDKEIETLKKEWPNIKNYILLKINKKRITAKTRRLKRALNNLENKVCYLNKKLKNKKMLYQKRLFRQEVLNLLREVEKF